MKWRASVSLAALAAAACTGGGGGLPPPPQGAAPVAAGSDGPPIVGQPYDVNGVTYVPADAAHYDELGMASYYGAELAGRPTANGEPFNPAGFSAAHRTLPLPSYVEVTALDTGRTILVRINDRGPFHRDRIIDLSVGAAEQLGIAGRGTAPVRVRRVEPPGTDRALLRSGRPAEPRLDASPQLLTALRARMAQGGGMIAAARPSPDVQAGGGRPPEPPPSGTSSPRPSPPAGPGVSWDRPSPAPPPPPPATRPAPSPPPPAPSRPSGRGYYVQIGAFSSEANANRAAARARSLGNVVVSPSGNVRRVRLGPFSTPREAEQALARARGAGYGDARIFHE